MTMLLNIRFWISFILSISMIIINIWQGESFVAFLTSFVFGLVWYILCSDLYMPFAVNNIVFNIFMIYVSISAMRP